jgi:hypothetical protein
VIALVYVAEAHARDEWPVGPTLSFTDAPKVLSERLKLAGDVQGRLYGTGTTPILVDLMADAFLETLAAWPIRFFVVHHGRLQFISQPQEEECLHLVEDLTAWLDDYLA